jgi:hypothetical protein
MKKSQGYYTEAVLIEISPFSPFTRSHANDHFLGSNGETLNNPPLL